VQVCQCLRDWQKHLVGFVRGNGAITQSFREVLLGILHDEVRQRHASQDPSADRKDAAQVRMVEGGGSIPALHKHAGLIVVGRFDSDDSRT
jgi:hypothetical protein